MAITTIVEQAVRLAEAPEEMALQVPQAALQELEVILVGLNFLSLNTLALPIT
jgi:hypothetical protein